MIEQIIKDNLITIYNIKADEIKIVERFLGGMSNYTYHIQINGSDLVVRVLGEYANYFVDRMIEKQHLDLVKDLKITPKVLFFDLKTGFKVSEYVKGNLMSKSYTDNDLKSVSLTLKQLHQLPTDQAVDYLPIKRINRYLTYMQAPWCEEFDYLLQAASNLYNNYIKTVEKVFCHGDAQRSNIVISDNQLWLLDFEFSGLNDPYYDLASFGNIDFNDAIKLLAVYLGYEPTKLDLKRLYLNRLLQVLQWHVVATIKHEKGLSKKLHIRFDLAAIKYLEFARVLYNKIKDEN